MRLILASLLGYSLYAFAAPQTLDGRVVAIADGDTLTILDSQQIQHKIRLAAIDAPEKSQAFGQQAKQALSDVCYSRQAKVVVVDIDRYERFVGEVTCSGTYANEEMLRKGMAWVYRKYAKGYGSFYSIETDAKKAQSGLWADSNPTPPWEWRKTKKRNGQ